MGTDASPEGSDQEPADGVTNATQGTPDDASPSNQRRWVPDWPAWWWLVRTWWLWAIAAVPTGIATSNAAHDFPIVQLELAGTAARASALGAKAAVETVQSATTLDFIFIPLYALTLFFGSLWASQYFSSGFGRKIGTVIAIGALIAGLLDVIENLAMLGYLHEWGGWNAWIPISTAAAGPKFALVVFAGLYLLLGIAYWIGLKLVLGWYKLRGWRGPTVKPMILAEVGELWPWEGVENEGGLPYTKRDQPPTNSDHRIAFCSSGGGIRSATYSLGAFQAMNDAGIEPDHLIGISGGAYIASARTIVNAHLTDEERKALPAYARGAPETENLRNNGEYLAPTTLEKIGGVGRVLLGLIFSVLLIGSLLVMLGRPWGAVISSDPLYPVFRQATGELTAAADDVSTAATALADLLAPAVEVGTDADDPTTEATASETTREQAGAIVAGVVEYGGDLERDGEKLKSIGSSLGDDADSAASFTVDASQAVGRTAVGLGCDARTAARESIPTSIDVSCSASGLPRDGAALVDRARALAVSADALAAAAHRLGTPEIPFPGGWWPIIAALVIGVGLGLYSIRKIPTTLNRRSRQMLFQALAWYFVVVGIFLLLTFVIMPFLYVRGWTWLIDQGQQLFGAIQAIGLGVVFAGLLRAITSTRQSLLASIAGGVVAPLMALLALINISFGGAHAGIGQNVAWVAIAAAVFFTLYAAADLNAWSLHPFYRRKLATVFAVKRKNSQTVEALGPTEGKLSDYATGDGDPHGCTTDARPELVVCAAANISDIGATPTGREAVSFTFSGNRIAAPNSEMGWIETSEAEKRLSDRWTDLFTLPSAVAISGAAFAPSMGKATRPAVRALMALANLRLGVWLPRLDLLKSQDQDLTFVDRPLAGYLFREIFGIHKQDAPFIYVTDGGHWENLGLVEALRRRCTEIYVFDAAGNPPDDFSTLGEAIAIARAEPGVDVDLDIDPLVIRPQTATAKSGGDDKNAKKGLKRNKEASKPILSPTDHVIHSFTYRNPKLRANLIYCKTAVTQDAPWDVKAYQEQNPIFPAHSTLDQFFDHGQFEAYRALGYHTARKAVRSFKNP